LRAIKLAESFSPRCSVTHEIGLDAIGNAHVIMPPPLFLVLQLHHSDFETLKPLLSATALQPHASRPANHFAHLSSSYVHIKYLSNTYRIRVIVFLPVQTPHKPPHQLPYSSPLELLPVLAFTKRLFALEATWRVLLSLVKALLVVVPHGRAGLLSPLVQVVPCHWIFTSSDLFIPHAPTEYDRVTGALGSAAARDGRRDARARRKYDVHRNVWRGIPLAPLL